MRVRSIVCRAADAAEHTAGATGANPVANKSPENGSYHD